MVTNKSLTVQGVEVGLTAKGEEDYISLTDMVKNFNGADQLIKNWLQNKNTVDFLGVWEQLNNPSFNLVEFHLIKNEAGLNRFVMSAKQWTERTMGVGLLARAGRYGGTYAHKDIAFEFGSWLSPEFKLYLIKEFQRFKEQESVSGGIEWNIRRSLAKVQYRVHTDAIKAHLIPSKLHAQKAGFVYASEAEVLNVALFGMTSKEWRAANPNAEGNIRDNATMEQLVVLSSLESMNALLIQQKVSQSDRIETLNSQARAQLTSLLSNPSVKSLESKPLLN